jgi:UDP-N-acetylmuramate dehydrogenase
VLAAREVKQPLDLPSAGSVFKRPQGDYASRLIDAAGLKGRRVGGAAVSEKHAGFIVNEGGATASDIYALIGEVRAAVKEKSGVDLQLEQVLLGEF